MTLIDILCLFYFVIIPLPYTSLCLFVLSEGCVISVNAVRADWYRSLKESIPPSKIHVGLFVKTARSIFKKPIFLILGIKEFLV